MADHTPTLWHVRPGSDFDFGKAGRIGATAVDDVATCWTSDSHNGEANAVFIVRAANAHDELVAALQACRDELISIHTVFGDLANAEFHSKALRLVRAALAKMEA